MANDGNDIKPVKVVNRKIAALEAKNPDLFTLVLWRIAKEFIVELYKHSLFTGERPPGLNRHWIMHGRDAASWTRADSLRLFQALDTVSSLLE